MVTRRKTLPVTMMLLVAACSDSEPASTRGPSAPSPGAGSGGAGGAGGDHAGPRGQAGDAGAASGGGAGAGAPAVQLLGRFDTRDPAGAACAWPGCRIVARFQGTRVSVRLHELVDPWMEGAPSEWDVAVDGVWGAKLVTSSDGQDHVYELADGLPDGTHVVELYKLSEAQNGATRFLGYDFGGGTLLAPPARKPRRLEIVGDSAASGYGVEGVGLGPDCPGPDYAARYQSFRKSLGARLGEMFDAEVAGIVYSGKGIVKNIWTADKATMPVLYTRVVPDDPTSTWDFSSYVPDAVVIMMGGNDFAVGEPTDEGPATSEEFAAGYEAFVTTLRQRHPAAHLFLTVSPTISDTEPTGRSTRTNVVRGVQEVAARRHAAGDAKVHAFEPGAATPSERTGCEGHGNPQLHLRMAQEIGAQIKAKTGW